jgi:hypothetical protein
VRRCRIAPTDEPTPSLSVEIAVRPHPAAWAGVAFSALFLVGFFLLEDVPGASAPPGELNEYYRGGRRTGVVIAALYIVPFCGIAFMWFVAALRQRVQRVSLREDLLFGTVQLLSGILFLAMLFVSAGARAAPALAIEFGDGTLPEGSRELLAFGQAILMVFALRCAGVFMITTATRAARAGVAPRWFRLVSFGAALILMFSAGYFVGLVLIFPIWVGAMSLLVLFGRASRAQPTEA